MNLIPRLKLIFIMSALLIFTSGVSGQDFTYSYDLAGNRTLRTLGVSRTSEMTFPLSDADLKKLKGEDAFLQQETTPGEKALKVYPNPTTGIIKLDLAGYEENISGQFRLFNLGGTLIQEGRLDSPSSELNMGNTPDGIYILKVRINEVVFDYKIIKK
ncbi:MAG: T9SS type A sorting domain-containing protein [Bacteroidales bacterium]|nr:T9SS type A sorting domain-containing protein [Bacteroidales bacterium]